MLFDCTEYIGNVVQEVNPVFSRIERYCPHTTHCGIVSLTYRSPYLGMRHCQAFLLFFNITTIYMSRLNIGVAIVAITNKETANPDFPEYAWNEKEISYILSSFFWGYIFTQFPGGLLSKRYGAKMIMFWSTFITALFSAVTPWCIEWGGWQIFCTIRVIQGIVQGVIFPCIYEHLAKWSPTEERNRLGAFSLTGVDCGTILAMAISGIIAEGPMGWPGIFYISAGVSCLWCLLWLILAANNPCESRFISDAEKQYIETSMVHANDFHERKIPIPWKAIFVSVPFYALIVARCAQNWGLSTLQAQTPSYMNGVLGMDIKANGLYSAMPFLAMLVMSYFYLSLADVLRSKEILSLTGLRRTFNSLSFWLPAIGLIGIGFVEGDQKTLALVLLTLNVALNSGNIIGSALNTIDLSPNHAGFLMSIVNTVANFTPLISPLVVGVVVTDVHNRFLWQIVFAIAAVIFFVGNLIYIIFGSTRTQPWDSDDYLLSKVMDTQMEGVENNLPDMSEKV